MSGRKFEPEKLSDTLAALMKRYRRIDASAIDSVRDRWDELVGPVLADSCVPEVVKDGGLVCAGAHRCVQSKVADE